MISPTTKKKVDILVNTATNAFFTNEKIRRLKSAKASLSENKKQLKALKAKINNTLYTDHNEFERTKDIVDNISEREIISLKAILESKTKQLESFNLLEESYKRFIIIFLTKIKDIESKIEELTKEAELVSSASLDVLLETIQNYYQTLSDTKESLKDIETKLTTLNIDVCGLKSEIESLENSLALLRKQYVEERKKVKDNLLLDQKESAIDQSNLIALESEIADLESQVKFYSTDPKALGEKIKKALDSDEPDESLMANLDLLSKLANAFYEIPPATKPFGIQKLAGEETVGELKSRTEISENFLTQSHFASVQKGINITETATRITNYKVQIYQLELIADQINEQLTNGEDEKLLKEQKRDIEKDIKTLKELIANETESLIDYIGYVKELEAKKASYQLEINQNNLNTLILESGESLKSGSYEDYRKKMAMAIELIKTVDSTTTTIPQEVKEDILAEIGEEVTTPEIELEEYDVTKEEHPIIEDALKPTQEEQELAKELDEIVINKEPETIPIEETIVEEKPIEDISNRLDQVLNDPNYFDLWASTVSPSEEPIKENTSEIETPAMEEVTISEIPTTIITEPETLEETVDEITTPEIETLEPMKEPNYQDVDIVEILKKQDTRVTNVRGVKTSNKDILFNSLKEQYQEDGKKLILEAV